MVLGALRDTLGGVEFLRLRALSSVGMLGSAIVNSFAHAFVGNINNNNQTPSNNTINTISPPLLNNTTTNNHAANQASQSLNNSITTSLSNLSIDEDVKVEAISDIHYTTGIRMRHISNKNEIGKGG